MWTIKSEDIVWLFYKRGLFIVFCMLPDEKMGEAGNEKFFVRIVTDKTNEHIVMPE